MQMQKKASSSESRESDSDSDKKKKKKKKDKKKKKKKKKKSSSSDSSSSSEEESYEEDNRPALEEVQGMPGFVYEIDKLGNKIISRAPPDFKKKESKKSKAMVNYNH